MTKSKRLKQAVERRKAGLVIQPPLPRPMENDHPALQIFKINSGTPVTEQSKAQPDIPINLLPTPLNESEQDSGTGVPDYRSTEVKNTSQTSLERNTGLAGPTQNFYRKTNTIADQVDRGLTPAESKVLDHLVRLSVGFNKDTCQVRVSTLLKRTGYRSDKTVRAALSGLVLKGMIERLSHHNNPLGDEYLIVSNSRTPVPEYRSTPVKITAVLESKITGHLNTLLKDNSKTDDEGETDPLAPLAEQLRQAYREMTGDQPKADEAERVHDLAQVLVTELRQAASNTTHVSSPAAFLAAHLRRRLQQKGDGKKSSGSEKALAEMESSASADSAPRRMSAEEIAEHTALLKELVVNGYSPEQAVKQFAEGFHAEDWQLITANVFGNTEGRQDNAPEELSENNSA